MKSRKYNLPEAVKHIRSQPISSTVNSSIPEAICKQVSVPRCDCWIGDRLICAFAQDRHDVEITLGTSSGPSAYELPSMLEEFSVFGVLAY